MANLSEEELAEKWRRTVIPGQSELFIEKASEVEDDDEWLAKSLVAMLDNAGSLG